MEGGDRALYKQEFKKSHKKHAKESLVPAFDVQAWIYLFGNDFWIVEDTLK